MSRTSMLLFRMRGGLADDRRLPVIRWTALAGLLLLPGCQEQDNAVESPAVTADAGAEPALPDHGQGPWFSDVTRSWNVTGRHAAAGADQFYFPAVMTAGAGLLDFDQDGDLDILLATGSLPPPGTAGRTPAESSTDPLDSAEAIRTPRLLRQDAGVRFVDVTAEAGLAIPMYCAGVAIGDFNNDGFPDAYLSAIGADRLLINQAGRRFEDQSVNAGISNEGWAASVALLDYDRDGWLDVFVTNYVDYYASQPCLSGGGVQDFCNPAVFRSLPDKLFRNVTGETQRSTATDDADASEQAAAAVRFRDVSLESGIALSSGPGLGALAADFNHDGWPDLYVANDGAPNHLWINQQDGTFRQDAVLWACATDSLGKNQGSMGLALADLNDDARPDVLVTNLDGELNALYTSLAVDGLEESAARMGLGPSYPMTGFGVTFADIDHDGDEDLLVANGRVRRQMSNTGPSRTEQFWDVYAEANQLFLRDGDQLRQASHRDEPFLQARNVGRALVRGDLDNDGDLDLVLTTGGGPVQVFRNENPSGHWLMLRAVVPEWGGRDAVGAEIEVVADSHSWRRWVNPTESYLASHDPRVHIGLGDVDRIVEVRVVWPDGTREVFADIPIDAHVTLQRGGGRP